MLYKGEFVEGQFIRRPNRFLTVVMIDGQEEYAHLPNPGRLEELMLPGAAVALRKESGLSRKTRYTLVMVYKDGLLVSLDTMFPNKLAEEAIQNREIKEFQEYRFIRREAQYKNSRFDLLLSKGETPCFVEVKSVSMVRDRLAMFPDAPTVRGTKHVHHLMEAMDEGYEAAILFLVQRNDADKFTSNDDTDPKFGDALREAQSYGVKLYAYICEISIGRIKVDRRIGIFL